MNFNSDNFFKDKLRAFFLNLIESNFEIFKKLDSTITKEDLRDYFDKVFDKGQFENNLKYFINTFSNNSSENFEFLKEIIEKLKTTRINSQTNQKNQKSDQSLNHWKTSQDLLAPTNEKTKNTSDFFEKKDIKFEKLIYRTIKKKPYTVEVFLPLKLKEYLITSTSMKKLRKIFFSSGQNSEYFYILIPLFDIRQVKWSFNKNLRTYVLKFNA